DQNFRPLPKILGTYAGRFWKNKTSRRHFLSPDRKHVGIFSRFYTVDQCSIFLSNEFVGRVLCTGRNTENAPKHPCKPFSFHNSCCLPLPYPSRRALLFRWTALAVHACRTCNGKKCTALKPGIELFYPGLLILMVRLRAFSVFQRLERWLFCMITWPQALPFSFCQPLHRPLR